MSEPTEVTLEQKDAVVRVAIACSWDMDLAHRLIKEQSPEHLPALALLRQAVDEEGVL